MIFYRVTDKQADRAKLALAISIPMVVYLVLMIAREQGRGFAAVFSTVYVILACMMSYQIKRSKQLNKQEAGA